MRLPIKGAHGANKRTEKYLAAEVIGAKLRLKWGTSEELYQELKAKGYQWDSKAKKWERWEGIGRTAKYKAGVIWGNEIGLKWNTAKELYQQLEKNGLEYDNEGTWLSMADTWVQVGDKWVYPWLVTAA